jgi:asparaginyl-tRNA synthetase
MKVRAAVLRAFRQTYVEQRCLEVTPPCMVQTQGEGVRRFSNSTTMIKTPTLHNPRNSTPKLACPPSATSFALRPRSVVRNPSRRHLSEHTHIKAELDFITFDDLLEHIETVICRILELTLADPSIAAYVKELHPDFKPPSRPFKRMKYADAITWLIEHEIPNEDGNPHHFGDDIAEAAERRMTDILNVPIFLTHFPVEIKAFYMRKEESDRWVTELVDVLMPGVGGGMS